MVQFALSVAGELHELSLGYYFGRKLLNERLENAKVKKQFHLRNLITLI